MCALNFSLAFDASRVRRTAEHGRVGFTLVELLVVIGIIAALVAILLPVLSKARAQANLVACMSNMRQLGVGMEMYIGENKGSYPISFDYDAFRASGAEVTWDDLLSKFVGRKKTDQELNTNKGEVNLLFRCPAEVLDASFAGFNRRSYSLNVGWKAGVGVAEGNPSSWPDQHGVSVSNWMNPSTTNTWSCKTSTVRDTSNFIVLSELNNTGNLLGARSSCTVDGPSNLIANNGYLAHAKPSDTKSVKRAYGNFLFADSSVRSLLIRDTYGPGGTDAQPRGMWTRRKGD